MRPDKSDWLELNTNLEEVKAFMAPIKGIQTILKEHAKKPKYVNDKPLNHNELLELLESWVELGNKPIYEPFLLRYVHTYNQWLNYIARDYYPRYFLKRVIVAKERGLTFVGRYGGLNHYLAQAPEDIAFNFDFSDLDTVKSMLDE